MGDRTFLDGPRRYGCDLCPRGERMMAYIEKLEQELRDVLTNDGATEEGDSDSGEEEDVGP